MPVGRAARALGITALVVGGAALGFVAERTLVHRRIAPPLPPADVPLGSIEGALDVLDGPDGTRLAVESYGPPDGPVLLLAHAWLCTSRVWHEQVVRLADRVRIVTYDHPGHGRSSETASGDYDLDLLGDALVVVVEAAIDPRRPFVVAGHSLGGMALLNAVRRHPQVFEGRLAGAVLMSTTSSARSERLTLELGIRGAARLERGIRRAVPMLRDPRVLGMTRRLTAATSDLSYLVTRWTALGEGVDPEIAAFTQQLAVDSGADIAFGLVEAVIGVDEDAALAQLSVPSTIMVGAQDRITPLDLSRRMAHLSGSDLVEVEGAGHMLPLEAPDEIDAVLRRHLERLERDDGTAA